MDGGEQGVEEVQGALWEHRPMEEASLPGMAWAPGMVFIMVSSPGRGPSIRPHASRIMGEERSRHWSAGLGEQGGGGHQTREKEYKQQERKKGPLSVVFLEGPPALLQGLGATSPLLSYGNGAWMNSSRASKSLLFCGQPVVERAREKAHLSGPRVGVEGWDDPRASLLSASSHY
ncbi:hypothetical protein SRHO_G00020920 [Serrasalmus rhombeus]